jgi:serine/threonine protein kinase
MGSVEIAGGGGTEVRGGLAKHRILLELGQGGMANVYLAVARGPGDFHKLVVLKVLRAGLAEEAALCDMARGEATIAARLNHANVVQTYEVLNEGERPVIVMEYLEGQSLHSVMAHVKDGSFTLAMRLRVLADALAGLHHAHELTDYDGKPFGLVHRDFTLQNIFVGYDGHVKLIDFGIAKRAGAELDTSSGSVKGKVRYMAPEQITGEPPLDRRADIFAAGMLLWELVTGRSPWEGEPDIVVINRVINGEVPSLKSVAPETPKEILDICAKAIEFDRDKRYATAAEMEAALEQVLSKMEPRILPRDIGRILTQSFGEIRASTKRVIEEQIVRAERGDPTPGFAVPFLGGVQTQPRVDAGPHGKPRPSLIALGLGLALAGLALVLLLKPSPRPPEPPVSLSAALAAASAPPPVPPPTPLPEILEVHVRAEPPSSVLYFDDERLIGNPTVIRHAVDATPHTIRAEARGYTTRTEEIVVDRASDMVLMLEKASKVPTVPAVHSAHSAHAVEVPPPANCNPSFFIDDKGIKRFKPECI